MKYSNVVLEHFFNPRNVGSFYPDENIGKATLGRYENGTIIHFEIKVAHEAIVAARFKAYGNCLIIAACSYATEWLINEPLAAAKNFTSELLIQQLSIPEVKTYCALMVADAVSSAIDNYHLVATP